MRLKRIPVLHRQHLGHGIMLRAGTVDELAAEVGDLVGAVVHHHPAACSDIGDIGHLDILAVAVFLEFFPVGGIDHHGHPLL